VRKGCGGKAAEERLLRKRCGLEERLRREGCGGKAAEGRLWREGCRAKVVEQRLQRKGSGGKAAEESSGGEAVEERLRRKGCGGKAVERESLLHGIRSWGPARLGVLAYPPERKEEHA